MAQNPSENPTTIPTMLEVCTTFGESLDGAADICQTPAELRYLVGNALLALADNLESAFPNARQEDAQPSDEAPFIHVEGPDTIFPESPEVRQKPVLEAPMLALALTIREQASILLNGSNRDVSLEAVRSCLQMHQEEFTASAEVVESFIDSIKPLETINFESRNQADDTANDFAHEVLRRLPTIQTPRATGPDLGLLDSAVHKARRKAA